jgi:hypothetical protein
VLCLDFDPDTSMGNIENRLQMLIMNARESSARFHSRPWHRAGGGLEQPMPPRIHVDKASPGAGAALKQH